MIPATPLHDCWAPGLMGLEAIPATPLYGCKALGSLVPEAVLVIPVSARKIGLLDRRERIAASSTLCL